MPLRPVTVRFEPMILEFIGQEATALGTSTGPYIRNAALARAAFDFSLRRPDAVQAWQEMYELVARGGSEQYVQRLRAL